MQDQVSNYKTENSNYVQLNDKQPLFTGSTRVSLPITGMPISYKSLSSWPDGSKNRRGYSGARNQGRIESFRQTFGAGIPLSSALNIASGIQQHSQPPGDCELTIRIPQLVLLVQTPLCQHSPLPLATPRSPWSSHGSTAAEGPSQPPKQAFDHQQLCLASRHSAANGSEFRLRQHEGDIQGHDTVTDTAGLNTKCHTESGGERRSGE